MDFVQWTARSGVAVRRLRENLGLSQAELGQRAALSQSAISRIESGGAAMSAEVLLRVSLALEVRPWAIHALADSLEGSPYAGQVETIATALAWASIEPAKWRMLAEFLTIARTRPTVLETVRLLISRDVGETIT